MTNMPIIDERASTPDEDAARVRVVMARAAARAIPDVRERLAAYALACDVLGITP